MFVPQMNKTQPFRIQEIFIDRIPEVQNGRRRLNHFQESNPGQDVDRSWKLGLQQEAGHSSRHESGKQTRQERFESQARYFGSSFGGKS